MRLGKCNKCRTEKYANEIFQDHILKTQCKNGHIADRPRHGMKDLKESLEHLRGEIRAERISYMGIAQLQSMAQFIDPNDVELLEVAGVPEKI